MRQALRLAERGRGRTSPNPMVGALVVDREGVIVGRGAHERAGEPHAEVHALTSAGTRAAGGTLYCTLEPCAHTGRTGPCAPRVASSGVARVVAATPDPNPAAAGGAAFLEARGVRVTTGVLAEPARRLNAGFFSVVERRRPFVTLKVAQSLDGRIAARPGTRTALTGAAATRLVHRERAEVDAIAVGAGTVRIDDPMLTARVAFRSRPLVRVIYDRQARTPVTARLLSTVEAGPVIIMTGVSVDEAADRRILALEAAGAGILRVGPGPAGLRASLEVLVERGVQTLVVEGGAGLHREFWDADLVDRVQLWVADQWIGDEGVPWLPGPVWSDPRLRARDARPVGRDVLLEAYVHRVD